MKGLKHKAKLVFNPFRFCYEYRNALSSVVWVFVTLICLWTTNSRAQVQGLNLNINIGSEVEKFAISPDGSRVVYRADKDRENIYGLYSVAITGGDVIKLNPDFTNVSYDFVISPDGGRVVYRIDNEIYNVSIEGGDAIKLIPNSSNNFLILGQFEFTPDGKRLIFIGYDGSRDELFSVATSGGDIIKLSQINDSHVISFSISPDSSRAVYSLEGNIKIYSIPIVGGNATQLNSTSVNAGIGNNAYPISISPDGSHVVYRADQDQNYVFELYSVSITGGNTTKLNPPTFFIPFSGVSSPSISPDGSRVVYRADQDRDFKYSLYSADITGGNVTQLNSVLANVHSNVSSFLISPDGSRVVYRADQDHDRVFELYSVAITGGEMTKLNPDFTNTDRDVSYFLITPDGRRVVYVASQGQNSGLELYSVDITGGELTNLSDDFIDTFDGVNSFTISPDGSRAVYLARALDNPIPFRAKELYSGPLSTCPAQGFSRANSLCQENHNGLRDWDTQAQANVLEQTTVFNLNKIVKDVVLDLRGLTLTSAGDINIELIAPDGTSIPIRLQNTVSSPLNSALRGEYRFVDGENIFENAQTINNNNGESFYPPGLYSPAENGELVSFADTFAGVKSKGIWTLRLKDNVGASILANWRLILVTEEETSFFTIKAANGKVITFGL